MGVGRAYISQVWVTNLVSIQVLLLVSLNIDILRGGITLLWGRRKFDEITKGERWGGCLRDNLITNKGVAEERIRTRYGGFKYSYRVWSGHFRLASYPIP